VLTVAQCCHKNLSAGFFDSGQSATAHRAAIAFVSCWADITQEVTIWKIATAGVTALFVTASPLAYAQTAAKAATPSATDWNTLTDMRIDVVKAALKLTPDQEKYWPPIEDAIRARAKNRQARFAEVEKRVAELREGNPVEVLRNRDTVDFLQRRADALAQRSANLKKLAAAWEPLYKTLSPDQKQRMAFVTLYVLHEVRNAAEERTEGEED